MNIKTTARVAGFIYLLIVLSGIFNLIYVPSQIMVWSDAAKTVSNIINNEFLFRSGIVVGVLSYVFYLLLPFALYKLFKDVNRNMAALMVILAAFSIPVSITNMINKVDVLTLLSNASYLSVYSAEQIQAQVMLLLTSYNNGIGIVQIFWGLWLFPLGYLIIKSGYIPKLLGVLLILGCFGYLIMFIGNNLYPDVSIPRIVRQPGSLGEIGTCLWLLIMGAKDNTEQENNIG